MQITVDIPDELTAAIVPGQDPTRAALEALGLEAYRERRISAYQLRTLLGIGSRWDLDSFLKERNVESYTAEDFERDWETIQESGERQKTDIPP